MCLEQTLGSVPDRPFQSFRALKSVARELHKIRPSPDIEAMKL